MYCKVICGTIVGIQGVMVEVEVDINNGFPKFEIVGMPSGTIRESKERVRTGMVNAGYKFPAKRIIINLAPAHIRKEGVAFDLAIGIGLLCCEGFVVKQDLKETMILGEIALDGKIRPIKGVLSLLDEASKRQIRRCIIPRQNVNEARLVRGIDIFGVDDINQVVAILNRDYNHIITNQLETECQSIKEENLDFSQVRGQKQAKRGLEIAVSGMHHAMLIGPPGIGKTMLAKRIKTICPPLDHKEVLELTKIYSAAEKLLVDNQVITNRPFRDPHHSITMASFLGGGIVGTPGEISLAHKGVLMLDEFPEFRREVVESLREPLEQGKIVLSRNCQTYEFPAEFMLIVAMNPCPCGYYPASKCTCLPSDLARYHNRVSGPIIDRIDLYVKMNSVPFQELSNDQPEEASSQILSRVIKVHQIQRQRYQKHNIVYNSQLTVDLIKEYCLVDAEGERLIKKVYNSFNMSSRGYHRLLKICRTIADMDGSKSITCKHIAEGLLYRSDYSI